MIQLIKDFAKGFELLEDAIKGLSVEEISFKHTPNSWNIKEIIVHIADTEMVGIYRMKMVLSEDNPLILTYNQDSWANQLNYAEQDYEQHLNLFKIMRELFLPVLNRLTDEDMSRTCIHNEFGKMTFKELLQRRINHIDIHLKQIQRVKDALNKR